jgi:hypothetical protein
VRLSPGDASPITVLISGSIAHVFTDMNAASKGVSLGIYGPEANKIEVGPSQPFVDILGRKVRAFAQHLSFLV